MELTNNHKPPILKLFILLLVVSGLIFFGVTKINFFKGESFFSDKHIEHNLDITVTETVTASSQNVATSESLGSAKADLRKLTYEEKLSIEKELNLLAVKKHDLRAMSGTTLYQMLLERGADVDANIKQRILDEKLTEKDWEYIQSYIAQLATEEENFRIEMVSSTNFSDLKKMVDARAKKTGLFYGNAMLNQSSMYKEASARDVLSILNNGATLPENALEYMIGQDNIDLAVSLSKEGVNLNSSYIDEFRSMNAFELHADKLATNPFSSSIDVYLQELDKLSSLGVPIKVNDGTRDALDIALFAATRNETAEASKLLQYAVKVNQMGISLEQSHIALLSELQKTHPDLYQQYAGNLK